VSVGGQMAVVFWGTTGASTYHEFRLSALLLLRICETVLETVFFSATFSTRIFK
jgi:hypothetical protein